ncbi:MAG: hypothetical protein DWQ07_14555 [Chloroflexi bacterium]|nr:MAG: hypothetical protein DWQ07_14555 [Chloroflexota bacterium]MBL1195696.1 hypothetical protein [Chloroflexota bacterium]NOH12984.1 hypothetical protein [Chloroflexota bacterium]
MINPRDDIRVEFDNPDFQLPGWPGYRTRPGYSGYDPLDYQYEYSHFQGRIMRSLITRDWHTNNLFFKSILDFVGLTFLFFNLLGYIGLALTGLFYLVNMGLWGAIGLLGILLSIYSIIWLGFREIDAILEDENG